MPADRSSRSQGRRPVPTNGPGPVFWPLMPAVCVCATCAALIPATDKAQATHLAWHDQRDRP
jgi:hypothetical protein